MGLNYTLEVVILQRAKYSSEINFFSYRYSVTVRLFSSMKFF